MNESVILPAPCPENCEDGAATIPPVAASIASPFQTTAHLALVELRAGRFEAARKILITEFEKDLKSDANFIYCRLQNLIQNGMVKQAEDGLTRLMFNL